MNPRAEDAANKILLAFEAGGIHPMPADKLPALREHVRGVLARAMESDKEKKQRKWANCQAVKNEAQGKASV
jgi:hypothetical protein